MMVMNIIACLIWCFQLIYGIYSMVNDTPVHPIVFILAVSVCILSYIEKILQT